MRLSVFVIFLVLASSSTFAACGSCADFTPFKWTRLTGAVWLKTYFWNFTVYGNVTSNDTINASTYCLNGTCIRDWNVSGGGGVCCNPFDQSLNTTDNVSFNNVSVAYNVSAERFCLLGVCLTNWTQAGNYTTYSSDEVYINKLATNNFTFNETHLLEGFYNKSSIDSLISGVQFDLFLYNSSDAVLPAYNVMNTSPSSSGERSITKVIAASGTLLKGFVSNSSINYLEAGVYSAHLHLNATITGFKDAFVYWTGGIRYANGTEVVLVTSTLSAQLTSLETEYDVHGILPTGFVVNVSGDKMVAKFYVNVVGVENNPTVWLQVEGDTASRFIMRGTASAFSNFYLELDGGNANTNIDVSPYNFTAYALNSTEAYVSRIYASSLTVYDSIFAKNASFSGNVSVAQETTVLGNTHSRAFLADDALVWDLTWTQIPYDTETFDVKNEFDTATYNFTARKAGYYDVVAQTHLESTWNWDLIIQVNGVTETASFVFAAAGDVPNPIVNLMTDHYYLNAGDDVNVWVYCNGFGGGQCLVHGSSPYTYFVVERAEA